MFIYYNANPEGKNVGDCTVRAISAATGESWEQTYLGLSKLGFFAHDMPSANRVWGEHLRSNGFSRYALPDTCPDCYTVKEFAQDYPQGRYILALQDHVVCVIDGNYLDTWDSGDKTPLYFWRKEQ